MMSFQMFLLTLNRFHTFFWYFCGWLWANEYWLVNNFSITFKRELHKIAKRTQTICRLLPTNCLSAFDHFVGLALKRLSTFRKLNLKFPATYFQWLCAWLNLLFRSFSQNLLTLSWRRPLSYRNQFIDLLRTGFHMITASVKKELKMHLSSKQVKEVKYIIFMAYVSMKFLKTSRIWKFLKYRVSSTVQTLQMSLHL